MLVTANKGSSGITFTVQGGMDLPSVTSLDFVSGNTITNCTGASPKIGTTCAGVTDNTGRSVVVASFADGSKQIIYDKNWGTVAGNSGSDYAAISFTHVSGIVYHLTVIQGSDAGQVDYGEGQITYADSSTGSVMVGVENYDNDISFAKQISRMKIVFHLKDGSSVTVLDQTFPG